MTLSNMLLDFPKTLVDSSKVALSECMKMPEVDKDNHAYEMDFVVRAYRDLIKGGLASENFKFQWKYDSIPRKHIDMIFQEGGQQIAVEFETIKRLHGSEPYLRRDKNKKELKNVGRKLRSITEEEVVAKMIIVPYIGMPKSLPFSEIETELQTIVGSNVALKLVHL